MVAVGLDDVRRIVRVSRGTVREEEDTHKPNNHPRQDTCSHPKEDMPLLLQLPNEEDTEVVAEEVVDEREMVS